MLTTAPETTRAHWSLGDLWITHLAGEETEDRFSLLETLWAPAFPAPLHVHRDADELYFVLEGELSVYLPGRVVRRGKGGWVYCPRGVPHTYVVTSATPARLLYVGSPAGFEHFVAAAGEPARDLTLPPGTPDIARAIALAPKYGIEILGAPGELPGGPSAPEPAGAGYWFLGDLALVHVSGGDTEGRYSFVEHVISPGPRPPTHVHGREGQLWYVLEGELTVHLPGETRRYRPGEWAYGPRGVPHTHEVTSEIPARILEVNSPAGFEDFIAAAGEAADELTLPPGEPDLSRGIAIAPAYGIDLVGGPGELP
jgi:mannose-6-phosphate isomerase-like protein (cupin superfamily)